MLSDFSDMFHTNSDDSLPDVFLVHRYYEMLDTVLVLLQKSRVPHFKLQVYHHAAVVPMAWLWCETQQSLQWGGLLFNTLVHVIMSLGVFLNLWCLHGDVLFLQVESYRGEPRIKQPFWVLKVMIYQTFMVHSTIIH